MATPKPVRPVLLLVGIFGDPAFFAESEALLIAEFGPVVLRSEPFKVQDFTDYYDPEMGTATQKYWVIFEHSIDPGQLARIKRRTNQFEQHLQEKAPPQPGRAGRIINLDPGLLTEAKVILASCKDHYQRIYLSEGVYAEVTLLYRNKAWQTFPWSYPDYAAPEALAFWSKGRAVLREQLKAEKIS